MMYSFSKNLHNWIILKQHEGDGFGQKIKKGDGKKKRSNMKGIKLVDSQDTAIVEKDFSKRGGNCG